MPVPRMRQMLPRPWRSEAQVDRPPALPRPVESQIPRPQGMVFPATKPSRGMPVRCLRYRMDPQCLTRTAANTAAGIATPYAAPDVPVKTESLLFLYLGFKNKNCAICHSYARRGTLIQNHLKTSQGPLYLESLPLHIHFQLKLIYYLFYFLFYLFLIIFIYLFLFLFI